jgi:hypothetical protein
MHKNAVSVIYNRNAFQQLEYFYTNYQGTMLLLRFLKGDNLC